MMNYQIETGSSLDPKEPKDHAIFSNRLENIVKDLEQFIKNWRGVDTPNLYINSLPKLECCKIGDIHVCPAKIIFSSTKLHSPQVAIFIEMNCSPSLAFLNTVGDSSYFVEDLIKGDIFGYLLEDYEISLYVWRQINTYFETGEIKIITNEVENFQLLNKY